MKQIEQLLRQTMGLHAATIGSTLIEHTVRMRMRCHGQTNPDDYLKLLRQYPAEWKALVETLVVTETWFFRDKGSFAALARLVVEEWLPTHPSGILRLLSVPCSSGEEPYSMAMALLDAGVPAARFCIDAVDISTRAITFAERAVYGHNSFRGPELGFRNRHFRSAQGKHQLNPIVRRQVRFQGGNLLEPGCLTERALYDVIFCRNLLIYFDRPTQDRTLQKLRGLLTPAGTLFVGPAEFALAVESGFAGVGWPMSFACRSSATARRLVARRRDTTKQQFAGKLPKHSIRATSLISAAAPSRGTELKVRRSRLSSAGRLHRARQLVDEGRMAEAAELCETHLRDHGASADAFFLLGWVRDAAGTDHQAVEYYRKALYLEPGHADALQRWALLSERAGNLEHARILRERAKRQKRHSAKSSSL